MFSRLFRPRTPPPPPAPTLHPPRAPPDHLLLTSFQILSRLSLIPPFRPWLLHTPRRRHHHRHTTLASFELLYDCIALGAPLWTLLVLLGGGGDTVTRPDQYDFEGISMEQRERYFTGFVRSVQILEAQGRLGYGEVLRGEDFLGGSVRGFGKVLRTVYRLLVALEETYPGIFVLPAGARGRRGELIRELVDSERAHGALVRDVFDAAKALADGLGFVEPCLECFVVHREKVEEYHERLLRNLERVAIATGNGSGRWTEIFGLDDDATRTSVFSAYRIICINFPNILNFLENTEFEATQTPHVLTILTHTSPLLSRISQYTLVLQDILDSTLPPDDPFYNSLCESILSLTSISTTMDEASLHLRTMRAARVLQERLYIWDPLPPPDELGLLLLEDCVRVGMMMTRTTDGEGDKQGISGLGCLVFLYERVLLCCLEGFDKSAGREHREIRYPILSWETGPALASGRTAPLDILHAIEVARIEYVECVDSASMRIHWIDSDNSKMGVSRHVEFVGMSYPQWEQWITTIQPFVPPIYRPPADSVPRVIILDRDGEVFSEDEDEDGTMQTHARPWSLVARKGPRSESSSFINQERELNDSVSEDFLMISPEVLPRLFKDSTTTTPPEPEPESEYLRSPSPLCLDHASPEDVLASPTLTDSTGVLDLSGKVVRHGRYPSAHGGFSDVWKGVWMDGDCSRNVAVKVLRSNIDDPELEEKMVRRLHRELSIWKNLDHPNIIGLLGTVSDFGHYTSMVCPWMENGSVSKYMERCGDIMSTSDRLKLLCEVAEGLSYLHSRSIVHGDLTGSNILITDDGRACLCDFGLSTIIAEFHGTSYLTSTIGGAVRWADALLYRAHTVNSDGSEFESESESESAPQITIQSDIYSFGSVMLEILSGRIPYHYIRMDVQVVIELHKGTKPRRPARSFVSDKQWEFMMRCWDDHLDGRPGIEEVCRMMEMLYKASLL